MILTARTRKKGPWTVKEVKLNVQAEEIAVQGNHPQGTEFVVQNANVNPLSMITGKNDADET